MRVLYYSFAENRERISNELVQMKQDGKIGWLDFLLKGDDAEDYKQLCQDHGEEPTEANAELYVEMTDEKALELLATI